MPPQHTRLLLIEDDPADHELIRRSLRRSSSPIQMTWARSLDDGLSQLQEAPFDIVLTDLSLPDCRGLETVSRIRSREAEIPIVVLTTLRDEQIEFQSLEAGRP